MKSIMKIFSFTLIGVGLMVHGVDARRTRRPGTEVRNSKNMRDHSLCRVTQEWKETIRREFESDSAYIKSIILEGESSLDETNDFQAIFSDQDLWFQSILSSVVSYDDESYQKLIERQKSIALLARLQREAESYLARIITKKTLSTELYERLRLMILYDITQKIMSDQVSLHTPGYQSVLHEMVENLFHDIVLQDAKLLQERDMKDQSEEEPEQQDIFEHDDASGEEHIENYEDDDEPPSILVTSADKFHAPEGESFNLKRLEDRIGELEIMIAHQTEILAGATVKDTVADARDTMIDVEDLIHKNTNKILEENKHQHMTTRLDISRFLDGKDRGAQQQIQTPYVVIHEIPKIDVASDIHSKERQKKELLLAHVSCGKKDEEQKKLVKEHQGLKEQFMQLQHEVHMMREHAQKSKMADESLRVQDLENGVAFLRGQETLEHDLHEEEKYFPQ